MAGIRMLVTQLGSPDGIQVNEYVAGREYDKHSRPPVSDDLVKVFVREGWAQEVDTVPDAQTKVSSGPSEVQIAEPAQQNKRPLRSRK
jgi:hypothetical protein